ncbi:hypothetical protein Suden_1351 [Sulfurimonas denitrificans DSM 1251]|uniref:Lipoprotein n=1 Tax=Sulfurimonas denitrificans (strain ATCC 33889 / DSM 1251) TaxID=326298 RepID=Q30QV2_SULDN|nr:hypothetical protein [Sulfurimonas denitrificans]ABB44629.1 hypothetical protein Suden_1351 [Sulfurimonas denitrificans DSM 1251]
MKIVKYSLIIASVYLLTGCVATDPCVNNPNCMSNAEKDAYFEKIRQKEKDESKSMSMSLEQYREYKKQKAKAEEQERLEHYASYEKNYLSEYNDILKNSPEHKSTYIQPMNKKETCKVWIGYTEDNKWFKEESYKIFWDGGCKNGYADGLGREIEKDTLRDKWGLAIYKDGKPTYYIVNDVLRNNIFEGIDDQNTQISYGIHTRITEKMGDIDLVNIAGAKNENDKVALLLRTSPFWNGTYQLAKAYPNFEYLYLNHENNDEAKYDLQFFLTDHKNRNGWAIEKLKNNDKLLTGEYVNNKGQLVDLPSSYNTKADEIIKEINGAQQKAYQAQEQAQLVKKQYMKKICKDTVKVDFMDNENYKLICNNYQREKELFTKINDKLERLTKEKIARLEQQRYTAQQQKEEQYRQQQLAIERQKMEAQQAQAKAARDVADEASMANFQNSLNNLNQQLQNNKPKFYNVTPTFGGGYNIMGY